MGEDIKTEVIKLYNKLDEVGWGISRAKRTLEDLEIKLKEKAEQQNNNSIKDIDNFKRELKREGLYSNKLEEFIEQYMIYYNK